MSSRAAAGRKRITKGEPPKRPSSSKGGLFSRSKANLVPAQDVIPPTPEHSPPLPPVTPFVDYHHARPSSPYLHAPDGRLGPADGGLSRRPGYASPPVTLVSSRSGGMDSGGFHSVYPAVQQIQVQSQEPTTTAHYSRHGSSARNGARGNVYGEYQQDAVTFVEATYQPPPPIQASYQPPPPASSLAYEDSRPHAPHRRDQPIIGGDLKKFAVPPSYDPPTPPSSSQLSLPSPHSSPPHISRQLHGSSPTPTELPTYSLSGRDSYTSARFERPSLQVAIEDTFHVPQSHSHNRGVEQHHPHHDHFGGHVPYPSPPSSQHPHLSPGPSPFNAPLSLSPSQSATSLSSDYDPRRPVYRGLGLATSSNPPSPHEQYAGGGLHGGFQISPTPSRVAPSLSGSSDSAESTSSGGRAGSGAGTGAAPPPTFFFPGSRSVAKPKISKKTGTPALIKIKSKKSKPDEVASSPVAAYDAPDTPTPNAHAHYLQTQTPPSPGIVGPDGQVLLVPPPRRPRHPDSVISDTMSFRSQESNAGSSRSAGSGPTTPNTPSVHSNGNGNGNGKPAPPPIIFPVGRSRAQPSKVPQGIKLKSFKTRPRTSSSASGGASVRSGNSEEQQPQASSSRARFMGIPLTRKKKSFKASDATGTESVSSGSSVAASTIGGGSGGAARPGSYQSTASSASGSTTSQGAAAGSSAAADASEATESRPRIKSRVGTYPLDPYDTVLLDNDRHTGELLYRLNPTGSPSFHNYGNAPPMSVLDLGCGQGHWVVDAAIAWKGYGTRVTGYDMVDVSKGLLPWAIEQGVVNNVRFIRGNFLKQRLPFSDDSFDLVRMSCLALCIAVDSWPFVLQEVCRVLEPGGRLELIDDSIVFPYGKFSEAPSSTHVVSVPPKLDITIPSASFSTFSIYDERTLNPGLGTSIHESDDEDAEEPYGLYNVDEDEGEVDDTATLNGREAERTVTPVPSRHSGRRRKEHVPAISARAWNRAHATSGDLEALFEHMLAHKFGIRPDLNEFILGLMKDIFGHAREVKTMNLTLAPPEPTDVNHVLMSPLNTTGRPTHPFRREHMGLSQSPGLVLWPSTFLPMDQPEIEIHVSKHMRILLSCKDFLVEHALEATEDEEIDEESVLEALWEYERFLRHRFNAPPPWRNSGSSQYSGDISDAASLRESIAESVSSDARADIFEIASEIGQRFEWQLSEESLIDPERMTLRAPSPPAATLAPPPLAGNPRRDSALSIPSPIYSRDELTHVRTFRVYEAIKLDRSILGL